MTPLPKRRHSTQRAGKRETKLVNTLKRYAVCKKCNSLKSPHRICPKCGSYK